MKQVSHGSSPPRILVVEDGVIMARDIERRLQALGYGVAGVAASGDEAVRVVTHVRPDLVLMDVRLKGSLDGIQAAEKIHALADVPIVYATAYSDTATLTRARQTDPFGYVLKPFDEKELMTTIEMALYRHRTQKRLMESEQRYRLLSEVTNAFAYGLHISPEGESHVEWVTEGFTRLTGKDAEALLELKDLVHPDDESVVRERSRRIAAGKDVAAEYRLRSRDGEYRWVKDLARPSRGNGKPGGTSMTGVVQDVTLIMAAEERVQESHRAREQFDEEIRSHISSFGKRVLALLESRASAIKAKAETWEHAVARVQGMIHRYESAYAGGSARRCPVGREVHKLTAELFKRHDAPRVTYSVEAEPLEVDARLGAVVLLVAEELITNSLAYGFPDGRKGLVSVTLQNPNQKHILLQIADDGVGLGKRFDLRKPRSGGLSYVRELCEAVKAGIELEKKKEGVTFRVVCPV
ncbi:MAG: response regulator [Bacteroidetes bacterium]|nr:response regulator [Bacteroidota bacterium]